MTAVSWTAANPAVVERERDAMAEVAPDMVWADDLLWRYGRVAFGWRGAAPVWSAEREAAPGLPDFVNGRRLELEIFYPESFPATPPALFPVVPDVPLVRRTLHKWHMNGDGSLCLLQTALDWPLDGTAADLVKKASGWFLEYLLLEAGLIDAMSENGINSDDSFDHLFSGT